MNKEVKESSSGSILDDLISKAQKAQKIYATFSQEKVDQIFKACAIAINSRRIPLAKMACEETGMGIVEDKTIKNHFASEYIYNKYKHTKTCGVIEEDAAMGIKRVAEPLGVLAGVVPTTNPTSTACFKSLLALKTRNAIVFSPHPRAKKCTAEVCKIINRVAAENGAPDGLIGVIEEPSIELSAALMKHPDINFILATGGPGMVREAYSSGKPTMGVGPGNTPAIIDETCNLKMAVNSVIQSKTFDNGMICASEQSVVVLKSVYEEVKKEFVYRGAYILNEEEKQKVGKVVIIDGALNAKIVGQPAYIIAKTAGITVPEETKILIGEANSISRDEPFSYEKLSPVLGMYKAEDFEDALNKAHSLVVFGGMGHTSVLYTDEDNQKERIEKFYEKMPTGRILVNMPSSQGAIGDIYNFRLEPSMTLGCGSWGKNATSENIGVKHLLNIKSVASRRENMLWYKVPPKIYFKRGSLDVALREFADKKRALIITDGPLYKLGVTDYVTKVLDDIGVKYNIFSDVKPDPTISLVMNILKTANAFEPDLIISLGGGSPIDAGKIAWLLYENPEIKFEDIAMVFLDIRKRICDAGTLGKKAQFVAIPTSSGTGSETTPFAVITDDETHIKYPITDYALTPNMAILDANLVMTMPKNLCAWSGIDSLTHALEAYASIMSTEFSNASAEKAIKLIFKYLPDSYKDGANNPQAREYMHYAASMAGMSFANAFLGVCHSLAHKLGAAFNVPHGLANALLICQVVKYNSDEKPTKQGLFPQYKYPHARSRYAAVADLIELGGRDEDEKVANLIKAITDLKKQLDIPLSIKDWGISEKDFHDKLDNMVEQAFNDQCTGANPVYPLMKELRQIYLDAYNGVC